MTTPARARVLVLNWRDTRHPEGGGSELYVEEIAAGLAARGHAVTSFSAAYAGAARRETVDGVRVVRRGGRFSVYAWAALLYLTGRLGRPDVVVDVGNGVPFWSPLYCRRPIVLLVHHVHREQWPVFFGPRLAALGWWLEARAMPRAYRRARVVTVSESTRRELAALGVRGPISVVHNGTPPPLVVPRRAPAPTICVLGRLVPHKRVEQVLTAAARLRDEVAGLRVDVAGQGYWLDRLRAHARALGVDDIVTFHGHVRNEAKSRLLGAAWVLALPSLKEGWGLSVVEAAAHGTPAVASAAAGGVTESIRDGLTGLLVEDEAGLVDALRLLLVDDEARERMGAAARDFATGFSWASAGERFGSVLDEAIGAAGPVPEAGAVEPVPQPRADGVSAARR
ncbi:MAG: glycosyltransferase family 4 protein [Frankiaceae bacterium]